MTSFKQFLIEGGKATEKHGTVRAKKADIEAAINYVSKATGLTTKQLKDQLLGSTAHTLAGQKEDSGDIDIALQDKNREKIVARMTKETGIEPTHIGKNLYSFAVPIGDKKVQVDLMFVPDINWAKFSYHSELGSKFKGAIRNLLISGLVLNTLEKDKDLRLKDEAGNDLVRASRSFSLDDGFKRVFKVAKKRKDGKGRVKTAEKASAQEVAQALKELERTDKFDSSDSIIRDPDLMAKKLLGKTATEADLKTSAEKLITTIKARRKDAEKILKDVEENIEKQKLFTPETKELYRKLAGFV